MMKNEFDKLIGKTSDPRREWPWIDLAYIHSPSVPDIGGHQFIANIYLSKGMTGILELWKDPVFRQFDEDTAYYGHDQFSTFEVNYKGFVKNEQGKPKNEVMLWLKEEIGKAGIDLQEYDYFSLTKDGNFPVVYKPWPIDAWRIACFAVTGGSEGHYIHIDMIDKNANVKNLILGKTFMGFDHALALVTVVTKLLA